MASCLGCYFLVAAVVVGVGVVTEAFRVPHSHWCIFSHTYHSKSSLLALLKQRPLTSTRFLVTAQTSTYLLAAVGPRTQTGLSEAAGTMNINMTSGGRVGHSDENGSSRRIALWT